MYTLLAGIKLVYCMHHKFETHTMSIFSLFFLHHPTKTIRVPNKEEKYLHAEYQNFFCLVQGYNLRGDRIKIGIFFMPEVLISLL